MSHQQTSTHGPAVDDALKDPRRQTSAGTRHLGRPTDDPDGVVHADEERLELGRFLGPAAFPGDRRRLIQVAVDNDANTWVREALERLPDGETFTGVDEILDELHRSR